jgi:LysR family pca operon transcriptional activator
VAIARANHPIFRKARPRLTDLAVYEFILPTFSQRVGQEIEHVIADAGLPASPETLRSTSISFIREMLHTTDMVTVAAQVMLAGDLGRGSLRVIPVRLPELDRPAGLMTRQDRPLSKPAETLAAVVRASIAEAAASGALNILEEGYSPRANIDTTPTRAAS